MPKFNKVLIIILFITVLLSFPTANRVFAAGVLTLDVNITGSPTTVDVGEIIEYVIDFSCAGTTGDCGTLTIDFDFDATLVDFVEVVPSSGYAGILFDSDTVRITDTTPPFEDGDTSQVLVRVRVKQDLDGGEVIGASATGTVVAPDGTDTDTVVAPDVTVNPPTEQWSITKSQDNPADGIGPAVDGRATYTVQMCPDRSTGNVSLTNVLLIDTYPPGAIVIDADGGTDNGTTITWNLGTISPSSGCQSRTVTLEFPSGTFSVNDPYNNVAQGFGQHPTIVTTDPTCGVPNCIGTTTFNGTIDPPSADPGQSKSGPGVSYVSPGGSSVFTLSMDLSAANVDVENVILRDTLPKAISNPTLPAFDIVNIQSGTWIGGHLASVEYSTNDGASWNVLGVVNGTTNATWTNGADFATPPFITDIRWVFDPAGSPPTLPQGFTFDTNPTYRFEPNPNLTAPDFDAGGGFRDYSNCITTSYAVDGGATQTTASSCANARLSDDPQGYANINFDKGISPAQVEVLQTMQVTLTLELTQEASDSLINPTIQEVLPDYLTFQPGSVNATFTNVEAGDETAQPQVTVNPIAGGNQILIFWTGTPGSGTRLELSDPDTGVKRVQVTFDVFVELNAPAGTAPNSVTIVTDSPNLFCQDANDGGADGSDIDGDGNLTENTCETNTDYEVLEAAELKSQKWIRSVSGPFSFVDSTNLNNAAPACPTVNFGGNTYTRYPCVAQGVSGGAFEYLMVMQSSGLVDIDNYIMYDVLPHIGDTGVSQAASGQARDTEFIVQLTGPITQVGSLSSATFTVEYNTDPAYNSCRPEMSNSADESGWQGACNNTWVDAATIGGNWDTVTSFRIVQTGGVIEPGEIMRFTADMQINPYNPPIDDDDAETGEIAWNTFAQRFNNALSGRRLLTAEPRKVGIIVEERYSVGNRLWWDDGRGGGRANNGIRDGGEIGIDGVEVQLWRDTNGDNVPDTQVGTDITHQGGYYIFDDLDAGTYEIRIPATEFTGVQELAEFVSSTGNSTNNNDNNDNGIDPAGADYTSGIRSNVFTLSRDSEPINEADLNINGSSGEGEAGRGSTFEEDEDSDLTIDFGFYRPLSLGNRVWLDDGAGTPANQDNGLIDAGEVGIDGVLVNLYFDADNDGIVEYTGSESTPYRTDTTANGGYYLFDLLPPGNYIVHVAPSNFAFGTTPATDGPLARYITSTGNQPDNETDNDDNGIDPATEGDQRANGVFSPPIQLQDGDVTGDYEPSTETDKDAVDPNPDGRNTDVDMSELTVDFGFFEESTEMTLGNRVWIDDGRGGGTPYDGIINGGEIGIDGVLVNIFFDDNSDGVPDSAVPAAPQQTTTSGGYYLFEGLDPGRYVVQLDPDNWTAGGVLENYFSTFTINTENTDSNDNGTDQPTYAGYQTNGIYSATVQLVPQGEPIAGDDDSVTGTGPFGSSTIQDNNSDNTVDFGVYKQLSLGNRVWLDTDNTGANVPGDGIFDDATENGVDGVVVNLYRDNGTTPGVLDAGDTLIATDTTAGGGYYIFVGLIPGRYIVDIPASNFDNPADPLYLHFSSDGIDGNNTDDGVDNDDNGEDSLTPATTGIQSEVIVLTQDGEVTNESDVEPGVGDGANIEPDNSDLSIDFGFFIPPMSIGNRVWFDSDNDGILEPASENGIDGVTVELFLDDGNNTFDAGDISQGTTVTAGDGFYLFDNLIPGTYFVRINGSNFTGVLANHISTRTAATLDDLTNYDDNGIDPIAIADYATNGVISNAIVLATNTEPTVTDEPGDDFAGRGANGEEDNDSNLTIDFGFFRPLAIGNRVWNDNGIGGGINDNGIQDGGEIGIGNVTVNLYRDLDGDGIVEPNGDDGGPYATTVTDANGYYIFDGLPEDEYIVEIPASNFDNAGDPLYQSFSSDTGNTEADATPERNDSGIDEPNPSINGVRSPQITLTLDAEPSTTNPPDDTDLGTEGDGTNGETDSNSDLTVDFGFVIPPMSIGNRVWFDLNNNGEIDATETFVPNARMDLYLDASGDGLPQVGEFLRFTTTDANGYYLFDNLAPGNYIVVVNEQNFRTGGVLQDYVSTQNPTAPTDNDTDTTPGVITGVNTDDGIDTLTPEVAGIRSAVIQLVPENEIDTETDKGPGGDGTNGEEITNSNLTVDFGFYKPMSIGNRIWFDTDADGLIDPTENGAANVSVSIFLDNNGDGLPDGPVTTELTDANGYYLFENLPPGDYRVRVDGVNFDVGGVLEGTTSTLTGVANVPANDNNDNGNDPAAAGDYITVGVLSDVVALALDSQPTAETNVSNNPADGPNYIGNNGETNNNSDLTIDFGFSPPSMSLGNRVWIDTNNDGLIDPTENGVAGVAVSLYRDSNGDGVPDAAAIATTTTDANGYYLFVNVTPGRYVVGLDNSNFAAGAVLEGYFSTVTGTNNTTPPEDAYLAADDDNNDNGVDTLNATYGLLSNSVQLIFNSERTDETDLGTAGDGAGIAAINSDLTIDFGVYKPMAIGNRVWFDTDGNGTMNGAEVGIGNVIMDLFRDSNGDGIPDDVDGNGTFGDAGDILTQVITDANGYYLFDGLIPGSYIVGVDAINFTGGGSLVGSSSTTPTVADDTTDRDDNGIDTPDANGHILSNTIVLAFDSEPTNDTDLGPGGAGTNGEENDNSNLTVDFGFTPTDSYSIGNRVWLDNDVNGLIDGANVGIQNVIINLYRDSNNDGVPDDVNNNSVFGDTGDILRTDTTDANGYYLFDGLTPGSYIVGVAASNFQGAGVLMGFASTLSNVDDNPADAIPPGSVDSNDNRTTPVRTVPVNPTFGVISDTIVLSLNGSPTGETDLGPEGMGANGETDGNSDLTIDFGFYRSLTLGNRVWFDTDNSGTINGTETGIANVVVNLYRDTNADGIPDDIDGDGVFGDVDDVLATDTTDGGGYYLFNNLSAGNYVVGVDAANFLAGGNLFNTSSSTGVASAPDSIDRNDNGIDTPDANGHILSATIQLVVNGAPTTDTDTSGNAGDGPNFRGINNESNNNSDLSVDFGFTGSSMSIGNRVWLDDGAGGGVNNDGLINGAEVGIAGVRVELFADANNDGTPDTPNNPLATTITDSEGYYLFDGLPPGLYVIRIAPSNFVNGAVLDGLFSSAGIRPIDQSSADQGIDDTDAATNGILSRTIVLEQDNEPTVTDEDDLSTDTATYGADSRGTNGETDDNSNLAVDFGFTTIFDWGDAPDTYGTSNGTNGPSHNIVSDLYIGSIIDDETDGQPSPNADGDDSNGTDDEDGVNLPTFVAGTTVNLDVTVFNDTGSPAILIGWFDWDDSGTFDPGEAVSITVPSSTTEQVVQLPVVVPLTADVDTLGDSFARFRLTTDPIDTNEPTGSASDGEVEDYPITIVPPGLAITKTDSTNTIAVGGTTTYVITIVNSGVDALGRNFVDTLPTTAPNGFDPATVSWTCTATSGASCISGQAAGTGDSGTSSTINTLIDIPRNGRIVYRITATLYPDYTNPTVTNTASLDSGETAQDINNVVADPPVGTKAGTVVSGNTINWTMVWVNTGNPQNATITDTLQAGQTFAGNLICTEYGTTVQTSCAFSNDTITWTGTIGTGNANRVEISFDVTVSGNGTFRNSATIDAGGAQSDAANSVSIGDDSDDDDSDGDGEPGPALLDPAIVKLGSPALARPGEVVTWTIQVTNPNSVPIYNVTVSDTVSSDFVILSVTSSIGTVSVNGQTITVVIGTMAGGEVVTITVETHILDSVTASIVINTASLDMCDCVANAEVLIVRELPNTGETPWWQPLILVLIVVSIGTAIVLLRRKVWRKSVN